MLLRQAIIALSLLFATPAAAQIVVTSDAYDAFMGATYIEDRDSNVVLTIQRELGVSGVDMRGMRDADGQWRAEYFCRPDMVLVTENRRRAQTYYLPYLAWATTRHVTEDSAVIESRWLTSMGTMASILPSSVPTPQPTTDIVIRHQLQRGIPMVVTRVTLTNRARDAQRMNYIYQDAAYMWFPDGDQRNTESVRITTGNGTRDRFTNVASAGETEPGFWQFAGTFNREHGVIAGVLSMNGGEIAGISGDYIGVNVSTVRNTGFYHGRRDFRIADIPRATTDAGVRTLPYINRFISLDFGELQPGQSKTLSFFRIMTVLPPGQRTDEGIDAWVTSQVVGLMQRAMAQSQGGDAAQ